MADESLPDLSPAALSRLVAGMTADETAAIMRVSVSTVGRDLRFAKAWLMRELQSQLGMTIVMVTHERPLAERFADRLATLGDGKLLSTASTKGLSP